MAAIAIATITVGNFQTQGHIRCSVTACTVLWCDMVEARATALSWTATLLTNHVTKGKVQFKLTVWITAVWWPTKTLEVETSHCNLPLDMCLPNNPLCPYCDNDHMASWPPPFSGQGNLNNTMRTHQSLGLKEQTTASLLSGPNVCPYVQTYVHTYSTINLQFIIRTALQQEEWDKTNNHVYVHFTYWEVSFNLCNLEELRHEHDKWDC